jgi:hypothetical protein
LKDGRVLAVILVLHADPIVSSQLHQELSAFPILSVRSIYSLLAMISDPRYELLIAQKSLIEPWVDCIEGQRPAMPIIAIGDEPQDDELGRRALRNAVIGLSDRSVLDFLASVRPKLRMAL